MYSFINERGGEVMLSFSQSNELYSYSDLATLL